MQHIASQQKLVLPNALKKFIGKTFADFKTEFGKYMRNTAMIEKIEGDIAALRLGNIPAGRPQFKVAYECVGHAGVIYVQSSMRVHLRLQFVCEEFSHKELYIDRLDFMPPRHTKTTSPTFQCWHQPTYQLSEF